MLLSRAVTKAFYSAYNTEQPIKDRLDGTYELLRYGYIDNARDAVERLRVTEPGVMRVDWLADAAARTEIYHRDSFDAMNGVESTTVYGLPEPINVRAPTDVMIARAPDAKQVMIAFGGFSEAFWVPPPFLELPNCHVVVLRDARRLFHLAGVEGLGADYAESVAGLKKLIADLGVSKVVLVGSSAGGYAALRYALDLDVRGVLAISPVTQINAGEKELAQYPGLRPIARTQPEMMLDLVPLYQEHPNPPKVIIVWGDKHPLDTQQATRMKVLPNVVLEPMRGFAGHPAWVKLLADQQLDPLLRRLLAS
jgi:Alpha/beta hydrolase family